MYLGIDIGGTNTDAVIIHNYDVIAHVKIPTHYTNPELSIIMALKTLLSTAKIKPSMLSRATFGSTLTLNAILQKKHDPVGLILAAGPGIDPLWSTIGEHIFLTSAKLDHRGIELEPLKTFPLQNHIQQWKDLGITNFACVAKFSTRNPQHEKSMGKTIQKIFTKEIKEPIISQGHQFSDSLNFPRRVTTAYWNSSIWRIHTSFTTALKKTLQKVGITAPIFLLKADGGTIPLKNSLSRPIEAIHSGPAASIMGIRALCPTQEDCFTLDIGGTTTDIGLLAYGQPLLAPYGLIVENRPTLIRSLLSHSLPIGGDSCITIHAIKNKIQVGPKRHGPAMAFGGKQPTLIDCLNIGEYAQLGDTKASFSGLKQLSEQNQIPIHTITQEAIRTFQKQISEAMDQLLHIANNQPIHILEDLIKQRTIHPKKCIITGGPSKYIAPILQKILMIPVIMPSQYTLTTNAIGAALAQPTARLELFASTEKGFCLIPSLNIKYPINKNYTLEQACNDASIYLHKALHKIMPFSTIKIDTVSAQSFSIINTLGQSNKEYRVSCQVRPKLDYTLY